MKSTKNAIVTVTLQDGTVVMRQAAYVSIEFGGCELYEEPAQEEEEEEEAHEEPVAEEDGPSCGAADEKQGAEDQPESVPLDVPAVMQPDDLPLYTQREWTVREFLNGTERHYVAGCMNAIAEVVAPLCGMTVKAVNARLRYNMKDGTLKPCRVSFDQRKCNRRGTAYYACVEDVVAKYWPEKVKEED